MARTAGAGFITAGRIEGMAVRVAVASGTGIAVDEQFGHATCFKIRELAEGLPRLVEVRRNKPACGAGW